MKIDVSYLNGLENPALEELAPELISFRDQVRAVRVTSAKTSCSSCEKRRMGIQLLQAIGKLRDYITRNNLSDVYNYLLETCYEFQSSFDHA